jgi:hypothetical protein
MVHYQLGDQAGVGVVLCEILSRCPKLGPVCAATEDRVYGPPRSWAIGVDDGVVYVWLYRGSADAFYKGVFSCALCDPDCFDKVVGFLNGEGWFLGTHFYLTSVFNNR